MSDDQTLTKVAECLYRNKHGTYFALLKVRGKQIRRSLKTDDSALARRRLAEFRTKAHGLTGDARTMTFNQLAKRWLAFIKPDLRPSSHRRLSGIVETVKPFFAGLPVRSIGQPQIEKWKIKRGGAVSARSFNYEREVLRRLFEYARGNLRIILDNPALDIKKRKVGKAELVIPTKEQFRKLVETLRAEPRVKIAADFVEFLGYSGLRLTEATQVRWRDVNFDSELLLVTGGEQGTKNHEVRTIPLFPPLRRLLERLAESQPKRTDSHRLFPLDSAKTAIGTACKKVGLPHFGHHAMRHFFCSNAIEAGCDFKVIAGWLGHKDGGVLVAQTYGHLRNEHSTAMAKRMTFDVLSLA
ncbi:integrase family protein [Chthoniobacter flavus Ellin428]|uniref:Integrase family protein n=2 Tax=Chthoniobacter flavus TaxID=191863 RepID=B4CXW6_9BACT|nr:integrase family protein [Chthoniobacter flavus Ellin428]TCO83609.1 site-specific recombinase XerD [Chthoniobacter flavus]